MDAQRSGGENQGGWGKQRRLLLSLTLSIHAAAAAVATIATAKPAGPPVIGARSIHAAAAAVAASTIGPAGSE